MGFPALPPQNASPIAERTGSPLPLTPLGGGAARAARRETLDSGHVAAPTNEGQGERKNSPCPFDNRCLAARTREREKFFFLSLSLSSLLQGERCGGYSLAPLPTDESASIV